MSDNLSNISIPSQGMVTDLHPINLKPEQYKYALNAVNEDYSGEGLLLQNDSSNKLCTSFPNGFKVIGYKYIIEQDRTIFFLVNPISKISQIGEILYSKNIKLAEYTNTEQESPCLDCGKDMISFPISTNDFLQNCIYKTIVEDECLNFNENYPIDIEYKITDCNIALYFTDNYNERKFIHLDYINDNVTDYLKLNDKFKIINGYNDDACKEPIYVNKLDCNKIRLQPEIEYPCINIVDITQGGNLKAGVYQFFIAYSNSEGETLNSYSSATNPTPIFERYITTETDYLTNKSIIISITNISKTNAYQYYNLAVAETINNTTVFKLIGTFPINTLVNTDTFNYTYTGNEKILKILSENDIFQKYPYYNTAKSVTKSNNYLFWSGLTGFNNLNLQRIGSDIKLYWQTTSIPEDAYKDPKNTSKYRSYMRDEVYSFALVFVMDNGEESCAIHIPGRESNDSDLTIVNNNDVIEYANCVNTLRNKKWQVYNTATVLGTPHQSYNNCKDTIWEFGEFSYWESTELYPNIPEIWGEVCGKPIRHHKFPDSCITHIHDSNNGNKKFKDKNLVFPIGVKIDHNSVITSIQNAVNNGILTQKDANRIKYYKLVRGNRIGHKSIIAKGLVYDMWKYNKFNKDYYYPNYPYNDLRKDVYISPTSATYVTPNSSVTNAFKNTFINTGRYTFHSPDTHFNSPSAGTEIKIETEEYGESEGYFAECLQQAKYKFLSTLSYTLSIAFGVASALSALEEKTCETYTIETPSKITTGGTGYVGTGGAFANSLVAGTGFVNTRISATSQSDWREGEVTEYNDPTNDYSETIDPSLAASSGRYYPYTKDKSSTRVTTNPVKVKEVTRTSCTGSPYQVMGGGSGGLLGGAIGLLSQQVIYKTVLALNEIQIVLDLITSLVPYTNFAYQHNSIGNYNNYKCFNDIGNKIRKIETYSYLTPEFISVNENGNSSTLINNWNRESSLYIKSDGLFPVPTVQDESRYINGTNDVNLKRYTPISSFYTSLKNYVPDQYGNIFNIDYINTGQCSFLLNDVNADNFNKTIFGGDIFINRFSLKIKHPFFIQTRFKFPNDSDVRYEELGNVGFPNYYFNTKASLAENISNAGNLLGIINDFQTILGVPKNRLDNDSTNSYFFYQKGMIYLYSYGIPTFLVESDINVDYRYAENTKEKGFYPYVGNVDDWLQEKNVPITEDNYYFYNNTYSKQNKEGYICTNTISYEPNKFCKINYPNRVIYSQQSNNIDDSSLRDNWLLYKANDYYDFNVSNGKLTNVEGIENDKVLVRFDNTTQIFNAYVTIPTNADTIQVGNGGMFQSKPQEYAHTDLGYAGSQHTAILKTEFGHIWVDAKRGQIFNLGNGGNGLDEISKNGMRNWFEENLPFEILKTFPNINIDNNFRGIGIALSFDKRFKRVIITKLDYKVIDDSLKYDEELQEFYILNNNNKIKIYLNNTKYFCNKSWTISYSFYTKSWVSYHSFVPNYYIDKIKNFQSGLNNNSNNIGAGSLWTHNNTNKSFQKFYGNLQPFIIETINKVDINSKYLHSVEFTLDVLRYHNEFDWVYNKTITFNKAIVYNNNQNSGNLHLNIINKNDLSRINIYPKTNINSTDIEIYNSERYWRFNQFYDLVKSQNNNIPIWLNNCANSYQYLNQVAFNYGKSDLNKPRIRSDWYFTRLINDTESDYKFIYKFTINNSIKSYR